MSTSKLIVGTIVGGIGIGVGLAFGWLNFKKNSCLISSQVSENKISSRSNKDNKDINNISKLEYDIKKKTKEISKLTSELEKAKKSIVYRDNITKKFDYVKQNYTCIVDTENTEIQQIVNEAITQNLEMITVFNFRKHYKIQAPEDEPSVKDISRLLMYTRGTLITPDGWYLIYTTAPSTLYLYKYLK